MSAIVTPPRMRISVDRYQKMVASGVLTSSDRVELIEGDILNRALVTPMHASVTARLLKRLILTVGERGSVGPSNPVDLGEFSEPEPDVVVLKPRPDDYARAHPKADDVLLLVEVADISLAFDVGPKRDLYARFGVREYWVVNVIDARIVAHRHPVCGMFQQIDEFNVTDTLSPQALPQIQMAVRELFGR